MAAARWAGRRPLAWTVIPESSSPSSRICRTHHATRRRRSKQRSTVGRHPIVRDWSSTRAGRSHFRPIGVELAHSRTAGLAWAGKEARGDSMSAIDDAQQANARFAQEFRLGQLPMRPAKKLAIVACMDARLTLEPALGLKAGDAHIIRNAGGIVTEDAIRSLLISHHLLGTDEWMIVNHTDCGMLTFKEEELVAKLRAQSDQAPVTQVHFHAFRDLEENVRSEEHTSELQSQSNLVCRLLLEKKKKETKKNDTQHVVIDG